MVRDLGLQTPFSEFDFHWVPNISGLVLNLENDNLENKVTTNEFVTGPLA